MITFNKEIGKDFVVLNLSDFHLTPAEWSEEHKNGKILNYTLDELFAKVKPNLVTVSGDLAWCGDYQALDIAATKLDSFGVPYAVVWGNHDQDGGVDKLIEAENTLRKHPLFIYERGPEGLGYGNYVIAIKEGEKVVDAFIMMDSHDHAHCYDSEGKEIFAWGTTPAWGKLYPEQIVWYKEQVKALKEMGCDRSNIIMHIPCFAYREAFSKAFKPQPEKISIQDSFKAEYWNEGFEGSFGVAYEGICSFPQNDGVFDAILEENHTKSVLVGHDHVNCFSVVYQGVRLTFSVKAGAGSYWTPEMNGGTTLTVKDGETIIEHQLINVAHLV